MNSRAIIEMCEGLPLWKAFYPRIYRGAEGFGDVRFFAASQVIHHDAAGQADEQIAAVGDALAEERIPTLWLDRGFAEAAMRSEPPADLRWQEMKLPFEAALLMLPHGLISHEAEGEVSFIAYARFRAGQQVRRADGSGVWRLANDNFILYSTLNTGRAMPSMLLALGPKKPTLGDATRREFAIDYDESFYRFGGRPTPISDAQFLAHLTQITFAMLLAITARPALVKRGERGGRHKKSGLPIWTPNIVGRDYRYKSEGEITGTGGTKRLHWRRGHFRNQAIGTGRTDHKIIWIEPMLIGGERE